MAANRIKGITIEIDGNTSKLQTALKETNDHLKNTQNNLKDVNQLLKFDSGNVDLLKQKQQYLGDAIKDTKDKLEKEKEALRQLKDADQTPEVKEQMEKLQRQISEDEQQLKSLKAESKEFGSVAVQQFKSAADKVKAIGDNIKGVGDQIKGFGTSATQNVTTPIAALGAGSIAAFNEVDGGLDIITRKTGKTGEEAEALARIMENIATSIPTDFETAGSAIGEVSTRFGVTGDELEALSTQFIKFADLNNTDVASSVDNVQKALSAYGLGSDDAGAYLDRLNKVGQETGVSVDKLSTGLVSNATAFKEMGLDIDQATVFMGQLEKSGANSETVLNGMRKALKSATDEGKPMNVALAELQDTILNGTGSMDGLTAAYDLFGKSGDQIYGAVRDGTIDFQNLVDTMSDSGGSVADTFEATVDPLDQFKMTMNDLKLAGADLGASIGETVAPILKTIADKIRDLKDWWDQLSPETQNAIVAAAGIAAAVGPVLVVVGGLVGAIGALLSPIGLVVVAIGAAIAIGVLLYQNWDTIKAKAAELRDKVVEKWNALKDGVASAIDTAKQRVTDGWNTIKDNVHNTVENIKEKVTNAWETVKSTVSDVVDNVKEKISGGFNTAKETVTDIFNNIHDTIHDKMEAAKNFVSDIIENIKGFFNFDWKLPDLKLPHIVVDSYIDVPVLGTIPDPFSIHVDWYKKAYNTPYLFTNPTVVGGRGFGDGGGSGELVYGRDQLLRDIAQASSGETTNIINVYAADGMNINQLADKIQDRLAQLQRQKEAVYA